MPTTRPRHQITETEAVARALDDASHRWPEVTTRAELLRRLVAAGHRTIEQDQAKEVAARREAVLRTSGAFTGLYGPDYLADLREDWPK
jgi:hypothetical protein